ncbi:unnamed protein product [Brassica oleracea]
MVVVGVGGYSSGGDGGGYGGGSDGYRSGGGGGYGGCGVRREGSYGGGVSGSTRLPSTHLMSTRLPSTHLISTKVYFGEHRCFGDGANQKGRVPYSKQLTDSQASHFTSISYIDGDEWLH